MTWTSTLLATLPLTLCVACASSYADRQPSAFAGQSGAQQAQVQPVSLTLERDTGSEYPSFFFAGAQWAAGQEGDRYNLRLTNHTHERVETVVTVDGRDVISGEPGNFKRQRGYVIEPFSSITVEGFRVSLDHVAAFRFTTLGESYTARRGTAENAGVIGVAVFREKERRAKKQAFAPSGGQQTFRPPPPPAEPFPSSPSADGAPGASDDVASAEAEAPSSARQAPGGEGFAPAPEPQNELGTGFGETTHSAVTQVDFKRRRKRKPDAVLTVYYDSVQGLRARGVPIGAPVATDPRPFPGF